MSGALEGAMVRLVHVASGAVSTGMLGTRGRLLVVRVPLAGEYPFNSRGEGLEHARGHRIHPEDLATLGIEARPGLAKTRPSAAGPGGAERGDPRQLKLPGAR